MASDTSGIDDDARRFSRALNEPTVNETAPNDPAPNDPALSNPAPNPAATDPSRSGGLAARSEGHDDAFWDSFDLGPDYVPRTPWYRKTARWIAGLVVIAMLATGALVPWGELIDRLDNVSDPADILAIADETVADSPYGWLVTDVRVRNIADSTTGGFVVSNPADGIITLDRIGWDPQEVRSTVAHEIGHLLDFAAYGDAAERRDGLSSEAWAECAAVDAGFRRVDRNQGDTAYHCTRSELEQYRFSVSLLGEVCRPWGEPECRTVEPIGLEG